MMGWATFIGIAAVAALVLALLRFPARLWMVAATALMLGAAGYAWQGSPALAGHPVAAEREAGEIDSGLIALREAMFGKFGTYVYSYGVAADAMARSGRPDLAARVWIGAVRKMPQDAGLWTGLGVALAEHDGNQVSPAAGLAFAKAMALAPQHPGPPFFMGLALVRQGRLAEARPFWVKAVELTPDNASYRDELRVRLFLLDRFVAEQAGAPQMGPPPAP
jgi:Flp pilus assembly protein TadD